MREIRIHGRGGQGSVLASQVLCTAFFREGYQVQSFASYGGERRGAPVVGFIRVDDAPILLRCDIESPDHVIVLDSTMLAEVDIVRGAAPGAAVVLNSDQSPAAFPGLASFRLATVDATTIARSHGLGTMVNTAMVGAFAGATGLLSIETLTAVIQDLSPSQAEANVAACLEAYGRVATPVAS